MVGRVINTSGDGERRDLRSVRGSSELHRQPCRQRDLCGTSRRTEGAELRVRLLPDDLGVRRRPEHHPPADNGPTAPTGPITNGRLFSVSNGARSPLFYELILQTDFGCAGEVWTVVRYTNVTLQLFPNIDVTFNVGTVFPS